MSCPDPGKETNFLKCPNPLSFLCNTGKIRYLCSSSPAACLSLREVSFVYQGTKVDLYPSVKC